MNGGCALDRGVMHSFISFAVLVCLVVALRIPFVLAAPRAPSLSALPVVLARNMDSVTVEWRGIASPTALDFIAIFFPANSPKFIGWRNVTESAGWSSGSGSISLPLVNLRLSYGFQYFGYLGGAGSVAVTTSNDVTFASLAEPVQGHLGLTRTATEMRVSWVSGSNEDTPAVLYGTDPTNLDRISVGTTDTYSMKDLCEVIPANFIPPGFMHSAVLTDLKPSTQYYYQYGSQAAGLSEIKSFFSAPPLSADTDTHILAYGDLGVALPFVTVEEQMPPALQTQSLVLSRLRQLRARGLPALILHTGDISYARGFGYLWEYFMDLISPMGEQAPYMVSVGNHDYDWPGMPWNPPWSGFGADSAGECGVPYTKRFPMPSVQPGQYWYSFDYGNVHMLVFSSEHNFLPDSEQYRFIEQDLASVNRSVTPWVLVTAHRPMYCSNAAYSLGDQIPLFMNKQQQRRGYPSYRARRQLLDLGHADYMHSSIEPLLAKYHVDVALWGHEHGYERTCGMFNFTCADHDEDATVHVIIGMAGNVAQADYKGNLPNSPAVADAGHHFPPNWSVFRAAEFGFTTIRTNRTHFHMQYIGDRSGQVHDQFYLMKPSRTA